jgi:hypothetical protein
MCDVRAIEFIWVCNVVFRRWRWLSSVNTLSRTAGPTKTLPWILQNISILQSIWWWAQTALWWFSFNQLQLPALNVQTSVVFHTHVVLWTCSFHCSWPFCSIVSVRTHLNTMVLFTTSVSCCTCLSFVADSPYPESLLPFRHHVTLATSP